MVEMAIAFALGAVVGSAASVRIHQPCSLVEDMASSPPPPPPPPMPNGKPRVVIHSGALEAIGTALDPVTGEDTRCRRHQISEKKKQSNVGSLARVQVSRGDIVSIKLRSAPPMLTVDQKRVMFFEKKPALLAEIESREVMPQLRRR